MKKLLCVLLSVLLIAAVCSGCAGEPAVSGAAETVTDTKGGTPPAPPEGTPPEGGPGGTPPEGGPGGMPPEGSPGGIPPEGGPGGTPPEGGPGGMPPGGGPGGMPPGGGPGGSAADIDYKAVEEIRSAETKNGLRCASSTADESALLISAADKVSIENLTVTKSGDSDGGDACNFYGLNAAVLVKDGAQAEISGGTITSDASGANGVFCYGGNGGRNGAEGDGTTLTLRDLTIVTTGSGSGGLMTTGGGVTYAYDLDVTTSGQSSAPIRTDRGGGTVTVDGGTYTSSGLGSPAIYSTAAVTVSNAALISQLSEGVVIEGKNSVVLENCALTADNTKCNGNARFLDAVMIYQSMSGDADSGTASFTMRGGSLTCKSGHVFHVTNTNAVLTLEGVEIRSEAPEKILLSVCDDGWSGASNAATVKAVGQTLEGAIKVGDNSALSLELTQNSHFEGSIDGSITNARGETVSADCGSVSLTLEAGSTWSLTGDSWLTEFRGDPASIVSNGYTVFVDGVPLTGTK